MRPADHADFFDRPPPAGGSRESTIRLDSQGRFWHDDHLVEHGGVRSALHRWIGRHPRDGRYILSNGYDWTYFAVEDAPFFVTAIRIEAGAIRLVLSDGSEEAWDPETSRISPEGALYAAVKRSAPGGGFEAKFTRHAQSALAPALVDVAPDPGDDPGLAMPSVAIGSRIARIGALTTRRI